MKDGMSRSPVSSDGGLGTSIPHSLHVAGGEQPSVTRTCLLSSNSKHVREGQELAVVLPQALQRGHQTHQTISRPKTHLTHVARAPTCFSSNPTG